MPISVIKEYLDKAVELTDDWLIEDDDDPDKMKECDLVGEDATKTESAYPDKWTAAEEAKATGTADSPAYPKDGSIYNTWSGDANYKAVPDMSDVDFDDYFESVDWFFINVWSGIKVLGVAIQYPGAGEGDGEGVELISNTYLDVVLIEKEGEPDEVTYEEGEKYGLKAAGVTLINFTSILLK